MPQDPWAVVSQSPAQPGASPAPSSAQPSDPWAVVSQGQAPAPQQPPATTAPPPVPRPQVDMVPEKTAPGLPGFLQGRSYLEAEGGETAAGRIYRTLKKAEPISDAMRDLAVGPAIGLAKGAGETFLGADNLLRAGIRKVTSEAQQQWMREHGMDVQPVDETLVGGKKGALAAQGPGEYIGKGGEAVLEFILGDEALKALPAAKRFASLQKVATAMAEHPILTKLAEHGLTALRQAAVGGGQQLVKTGGDVESAKTAGELAGGISLGAGALGELGGAALQKIMPKAPGVPMGTAAETIPAAEELKPAGEKIAPELGPQAPATQYPRTPEEAQAAIGERPAAGAAGPQEAGVRVQAEQQALRAAKGAEVGEAKEALKKTLPGAVKPDAEYAQRALDEAKSVPDRGFVKNPYAESTLENLTPEQQLKIATRANEIKATETGQIPFPKDGQAVKEARDIAAQLGEEKLGLKDPNSPLGKLVSSLMSGENPAGGDLSFSFEDAQASRKALSNAIKVEHSKFKAGGDGTVYRRLIGLKQAFDEDLYDTWEKYGDAAQAQKVRQLGREYAKIVNEQYTGPAKAIFKTTSPEKIIPGIVTGGVKSQSVVESILKSSSPEGREAFRDSIEKEIYRQAAKPDGTVDAVKAAQKLARMGDTGKLIFGKDHQGLTTFLGDLAKKQGETGTPFLSLAETENPEHIVHGIVSGGAKAQSRVESMVGRLSEEGRATLRDSSLKEIYRRNLLPNGDIDMAGSRDHLQKMGQTGNSLFGDQYQEIRDFLDAAAKQQEVKQAAADKEPFFRSLIRKQLRAAGAMAGWHFGLPGLVVGAEAGGVLDEAVFGAAKSGAIKVGISPTEQVLLSPAQAAKNRPAVTAFLNALSSGKTTAAVAAYNTLSAAADRER